MTALHQHVTQRQWLAELKLSIESRAGRTILAQSHHFGPLRIQKLLYPEGPQCAQALIIHPPGGIAAGDQLKIDVSVAPAADIQLTTPGATKWYRCQTAISEQDIQMTIGDNAYLEWLPQESIYFDGARTRQSISVNCHERGSTCGWEMTVLGRRQSGETFKQGRLRQSIKINRQGKLLWHERVALEGSDPLLKSVIGWRDRHVSATLWALGMAADDSLIEACRAINISGVMIGLTRMDNGLLLARTLAHDVESTHKAMTALWSCLRPALCGRAAMPPRIWAT